MDKIRKAIIAIFVMGVALFVAPLSAAAGPPPPGNVDTTDVSTFVIAAPLVTIITALVIPLVNGFLTKATTHTGVKIIGTIVLNTVAALITTGLMADGTSAFSDTTLYTALLGCIISIASYVGVYKPLNYTSNEGGKLATVGVR